MVIYIKCNVCLAYFNEMTEVMPSCSNVILSQPGHFSAFHNEQPHSLWQHFWTCLWPWSWFKHSMPCLKDALSLAKKVDVNLLGYCFKSLTNVTSSIDVNGFVF